MDIIFVGFSCFLVLIIWANIETFGYEPDDETVEDTMDREAW